MLGLATIASAQFGNMNMDDMMKGFGQGGGGMQDMMKGMGGMQDMMKNMQGSMGGGQGGQGGAPRPSADEVKKMVLNGIMSLDKDKDGKVTKGEYDAANKDDKKASEKWDMIIKLGDTVPCDGKMSRKEAEVFVNDDPVHKDNNGDLHLSKEELGDDKTWKAMEADGKIKDGKISIGEFMVYAADHAKCDASSLSAALSMLAFVLVARIFF